MDEILVAIIPLLIPIGLIASWLSINRPGDTTPKGETKAKNKDDNTVKDDTGIDL